MATDIQIERERERERERGGGWEKGDGQTGKSIFITMDDLRQNIWHILFSNIRQIRVVALHDENAGNDYARYLIFVDISCLVFKL